jgi:hypothetical protein
VSNLAVRFQNRSPFCLNALVAICAIAICSLIWAFAPADANAWGYFFKLELRNLSARPLAFQAGESYTRVLQDVDKKWVVTGSDPYNSYKWIPSGEKMRIVEDHTLISGIEAYWVFRDPNKPQAGTVTIKGKTHCFQVGDATVEANGSFQVAYPYRFIRTLDHKEIRIQVTIVDRVKDRNADEVLTNTPSDGRLKRQNSPE